MRGYLIILIKALLLAWQLPQAIIGFLFSRGAERKRRGDVAYYQWKRRGSISLGPFIIVDDPASIDHERAHSVQSRMLGPLYLIVIGLPSLIWCALYSYTGLRHRAGYYSFYTEAWAEAIRRRRWPD